MADRVSQLLSADARRYRQWIEARMGYRPLSWFLDPGFVCLVIQRLAHACHLRGANLSGRFFMQINSILTGIDITPATSIGPGALIPHPCGVIMSGRAGAGLTVLSRGGFGVGAESKDAGGGPGLPIFGNDVLIGAFSGAQGAYRYGDGIIIENGAYVRADVPSGSRCIAAVDPLIAPRDDEVIETSVPAAVPVSCPHRSIRKSYADWRADAQRILDELARYGGRERGRLGLLVAMSWLPVIALAIQRTAHCLHLRGHRFSARFVSGWNLCLFRFSAPARTCIGGGALMPHLAGCLLDARTDARPTFYADFVVAPWRPGDAQPCLGVDVAVNGHCGVMGPVHIGNDVNIGPKSQVSADLPDHARAFSGATRVRQFSPGVIPRLPVQRPPLGSDPHSPWGEYRACLPRDRARLRAVAGSPSLAARVAIRLFRLGRACHRSGLRRTAHWLWRANLYFTGFDGHFASRIGPGLAMPYPAGLSLFCHAGDDLTLMAQACVGPEADCPPDRAVAEVPLLGANVWIDHHGAIYGPAMVGDGARIMPGCRLRGDLPAAHAALAGPLRILTRQAASALEAVP